MLPLTSGVPASVLPVADSVCLRMFHLGLGARSIAWRSDERTLGVPQPCDDLMTWRHPRSRSCPHREGRRANRRRVPLLRSGDAAREVEIEGIADVAIADRAGIFVLWPHHLDAERANGSRPCPVEGPIEALQGAGRRGEGRARA